MTLEEGGTLGYRVIQSRLVKDMSMVEFSRQLGIEEKRLSLIERDMRPLRDEEARKIVEITGVDLWWLLSGEKEKRKKYDIPKAEPVYLHMVITGNPEFQIDDIHDVQTVALQIPENVVMRRLNTIMKTLQETLSK